MIELDCSGLFCVQNELRRLVLRSELRRVYLLSDSGRQKHLFDCRLATCHIAQASPIETLMNAKTKFSAKLDTVWGLPRARVSAIC